MFLSWLPVMMRSPSGSHTAEVTSAECCFTTSMQDPFAMLHILSDPSLPAQDHVTTFAAAIVGAATAMYQSSKRDGSKAAADSRNWAHRRSPAWSCPGSRPQRRPVPSGRAGCGGVPGAGLPAVTPAPVTPPRSLPFTGCLICFKTWTLLREAMSQLGSKAHGHGYR